MECSKKLQAVREESYYLKKRMKRYLISPTNGEPMLKLSSTRNLCTTTKIVPSRKNEREKHLSPSRRRALRWFFVQTIRVVQLRLQARLAVGLHGVMVIARCEKFCKGVQWTVQMAVHNASTLAVNLSGKYEQKQNKIWDLRGFPNGDWSFIRAHNPLVAGSSPAGPTTQESRALRGFCASGISLKRTIHAAPPSPKNLIAKRSDDLFARVRQSGEEAARVKKH